MNAIARLDPRRHHSAAIGWATFVIIALASLAAAQVDSADAERAAVSDTERLLNQFAAQIGDRADTSLGTRLSIVQATAAQIVPPATAAPTPCAGTEALRAQFPGVRMARPRRSAGAYRGGDRRRPRWRQRGRAAVVPSGTVCALPRHSACGAAEGGWLDRRSRRAGSFVDAAAPLGDATERPRGVIGARLSWTWIERLQAGLLGSLDTRRRLQLMLADGDGLCSPGPRSGWGVHSTRMAG